MLAQQQNSTTFCGTIHRSSVLIYLDDFHGKMEFFSIIDKIVQGSGFEEVVYQAGLCTPGGIKGVLSGKHYNRSWKIHESFAEAIERLFCKTFVKHCPEELASSIKSISSVASSTI